VLSALRSVGLPVRVHAGGQALDMIEKNLAATVEPRVPLTPSPLAPVLLARRVGDDLRAFRRTRPTLVVSDGDQSAVLAARALGIDAIVIGHDLVFKGLVSLPPLPTQALWSQRLNAFPMWAGSRFIAMHFLPASSDDPRVRVARPDRLLVSGPTRRDGGVVCYFRDGDPAGVASAVAARGFRVVCFGDKPVAPGVEVRPFSRIAFAEALENCSAVVTSAGSNVLAECVALGKPMLALYRRGDSEQRLNATLAELAGVAVGSEFETAVPRAVETFVARLRTNDFAVVDLERALPPLSLVVRRTVARWLDTR
jgi:UDP-N-acetylglucosamine--N-acetylmuramyl-(pentapeptide) pyrophosphoryl-undecaprenol N-acetylglucosamine transferase